MFTCSQLLSAVAIPSTPSSGSRPPFAISPSVSPARVFRPVPPRSPIDDVGRTRHGHGHAIVVQPSPALRLRLATAQTSTTGPPALDTGSWNRTVLAMALGTSKCTELVRMMKE